MKKITSLIMLAILGSALVLSAGCKKDENQAADGAVNGQTPNQTPDSAKDKSAHRGGMKAPDIKEDIK